MNSEHLVADEHLVALTRRQDLEPVEGRGAPVHPPTFPAPRNARGGSSRTSIGGRRRGPGLRGSRSGASPGSTPSTPSSQGGC